MSGSRLPRRPPIVEQRFDVHLHTPKPGPSQAALFLGWSVEQAHCNARSLARAGIILDRPKNSSDPQHVQDGCCLSAHPLDPEINSQCVGSLSVLNLPHAPTIHATLSPQPSGHCYLRRPEASSPSPHRDNISQLARPPLPLLRH
jgi:hypothetical protein